MSKRKSPPKSPPSRAFNIRLTPDDERQLSVLEAKLGLKRAQVIRYAIRQAAREGQS